MIPTIITALMLFGCLIGGLPYAYFQLLRWVVCGTSIYRISRAFEAGQGGWLWTFVVVAILFNPIIPFHFDRDAWVLIDLAIGVLMLASLVALKSMVDVKAPSMPPTDETPSQRMRPRQREREDV